MLRQNRGWTLAYALTFAAEVVGLYGAALMGRRPLDGFYMVAAYSAPAVLLLLAGVLALGPATPRPFRGLVWTRAAVLLVVWSTVALAARDPYVPGSCADVRTGCVRVEDAATPAR